MAAEQVQFRQLLINTGLNQNTIFILGDQGVTTLPLLASMSDTDINNTITHINRYLGPRMMMVLNPAFGMVQIPQATIPRFLDMKYWYEMRMKTAQDPSSQLLTAVEIQETTIRREFVTCRKKSLEDQTLREPPVLKSFREWPKWWELFDNYMKQLYGDSDVNLSYVYREHTAVTPAMLADTYGDDDERYYNILALNTTGYLLDCTRVWTELKGLVIDGPRWEFIQAYEADRDGRGAVLALKEQNEGENSVEMRKTNAYTALNSLLYEGPRKHWTFTHFVTAHQKHYNILRDCKEEVPAAIIW